MLALLLTLCPALAAIVALVVVGRLAREERLVLALACAAFAASALLSPNSFVHDHFAHFRHARAAWLHPLGLLDGWDRPGFMLLYTGPARVGLVAARIFSLVPAAVTRAATMLAARALGMRRTWIVGVFVAAQLDFFGEASSTMTELLFAAGFAVACWGFFERRPWLCAAGLAFAGLTRPEAPFLIAACAAVLLSRERRLAPAVATLLPFVAYAVIEGALHHDLLWYFNHNAYGQGGVGLRLEVRQLWSSFFYDAIWDGQPVPLLLLEVAGVVVALRSRPRLLFLLAPIAVSWGLLTFLRIGQADWWRQSRYLVAIAPALALLAAVGEAEVEARWPRLGGPVLLLAGGVSAGVVLVKSWRPPPAWSPGAPLALISGCVLVAALLWALRRRVAVQISLAAALAAPLLLSPPGSFNRHRQTPVERASAEVVRWLARRGAKGPIGFDVEGLEAACADQLADPCPIPLRSAAASGPDALFVKQFCEGTPPSPPPRGWRETWRWSGVRVHGPVLFPVAHTTTVVVWEPPG